MSFRFSLCVPNFNYADYLTETLESALAQDWEDLEVLVCDNASSDHSIDVIERIDDPRVRLTVNQTNVGFAPNLDRAVRPATGEWILLLSSDDLVLDNALSTYGALISALGALSKRIVLSSACRIIDGSGETVGRHDLPSWCWGDVAPDPALSKIAGAPVLRQSSQEVLAKSLRHLRNPLLFVATAYPRVLYDKVEGYRGTSLINPDKIFHWRLAAAADEVVVVDEPLFAYRVHGASQAAQQQQSGALKHLVDQYTYTFSLEQSVLDHAGLTRSQLEAAFIHRDIEQRALLALTRGEGLSARRMLDFGRAAYPKLYRRRTALPLLRVASRLPSRVLRSMRPLARRYQSQSALTVAKTREKAL